MVYFKLTYQTLRAKKLFVLNLENRKIDRVSKKMNRIFKTNVKFEKLWIGTNKFDVKVPKCNNLCYRFLTDGIFQIFDR